jgi:hypothetical protein
MPVQHFSELLDVNDCKIRKLLTDPAGGTASYSSWVDVPDVTNVQVEGEVDVKKRRGDGVVRSQRLIITGMKCTIENTVLDLDVKALLEGGTVVDSGTGTTEKARFVFGKANVPPYVQMEAQCTTVSLSGADVHLSLYKASLNNVIPFGFGGEDFKTFSYELGAVARDSDDNYGFIDINETAVAIS